MCLGKGNIGNFPAFAWIALSTIQFTDAQFPRSCVFSYGVTIWEILTRDVPYKGMRNETDLVRAAINKTLELKIPDSCPKLLQDLLIG